MSILNDIKNQVKKAGANKGKFLYFKSGVKVRFRFLQDVEDGAKVPFHDSFSKGINVPCQAVFDRDCEYCQDEELRTRDLFLWCVWEHEAKEVRILMAAVNSFSPIPALVGMYETYGTLLDRDYVVTRTGTQTSTAYSVVPLDKVKFTNTKAKPFSKSKLLEILDKAYPADETAEMDLDDESGEELEREIATRPKNKQIKTAPVYEGEEQDYDEMSAVELYKLCVKKGIAVTQRQNKQYYVDRLNDSGDEDDDDWN